MKKFKILALVMTCAILLSSFAIIPVSAETELDLAPAGSTLVKTVNFEDLKDTFNNNIITNAADNVTFTPGDDGSAVTINKADTATDSKRTFWGATFNDLKADATTVYTMIYKVSVATHSNGDEAFGVGGWFPNGTFTNTNTAADPNMGYYGQYGDYLTKARLTTGRTNNGEGTFANRGNFSLYTETIGGKSFVTTKLVYNGINGTYANYYLNSDQEWVKIVEYPMSVGANDTMGFVLYVYRPNVTNGTIVRDVKIYEGTAFPAATSVDGKTVTIDGVANANEGWSQNALLTLGVYQSTADKTPQTVGTAWATANDAPTMKVSYDANNLYMYYEADYNAAQNVSWTSERGATTNSNHRLYIILTPSNGVHAYSDASKFSKNGDTFRLQVDMGKPADGSTSVIWKGSDDNATVANGSLVRGYDYGDLLPNWTNQKFADGDAMWEGLEVAFTYSETKKTVEIKIPLGETYAQNLKNNADSNVRIAVFDSHGSWKGYSTGAMEYDTTGKNPYGVNITIPRDVAMSDKTAITTNLVGFQSREGATEGTYDVRFVAVVDDAYEIDLATAKLGYLFGYNGKTSQQYCTKVYEELKAGEDTIKASTYGGKYFFCFTITGLSETESYTFDVKCFTKVASATYYEYCQNPVTVTITYENGEAVFTTGQNG